MDKIYNFLVIGSMFFLFGCLNEQSQNQLSENSSVEVHEKVLTLLRYEHYLDSSDKKEIASKVSQARVPEVSYQALASMKELLKYEHQLRGEEQVQAWLTVALQDDPNAAFLGFEKVYANTLRYAHNLKAVEKIAAAITVAKTSVPEAAAKSFHGVFSSTLRYVNGLTTAEKVVAAASVAQVAKPVEAYTYFDRIFDSFLRYENRLNQSQKILIATTAAKAPNPKSAYEQFRKVRRSLERKFSHVELVDLLDLTALVSGQTDVDRALKMVVAHSGNIETARKELEHSLKPIRGDESGNTSIPGSESDIQPMTTVDLLTTEFFKGRIFSQGPIGTFVQVKSLSPASVNLEIVSPTKTVLKTLRLNRVTNTSDNEVVYSDSRFKFSLLHLQYGDKAIVVATGQDKRGNGPELFFQESIQGRWFLRVK